MQKVRRSNTLKCDIKSGYTGKLGYRKIRFLNQNIQPEVALVTEYPANAKRAETGLDILHTILQCVPNIKQCYPR